MSDALKHIYNACDPYEAATGEYYYDCSEARGSSAFIQEFQKHLAFADNPRSFLFTGHIGCGKSSELKELSRVLDHSDMSHKRYFPVFLNMMAYIDEYDVDIPDILLAIISELAATLREKIGVELKDNYFVKRFNEVKGIFLSDVELTEGELPLWGAKLKIQRLRKDPDARKKVREMLAPKMSTMLEEINTVFDEARLAVKKVRVQQDEQPYTDFVLILDNMEKIQRFAGKAEGLESQRELFLERARQLTGMKAHVIYTVPLRLVRSADGPQLKQRYSNAPFVLPMVKVINRGTLNPYNQGLDCLRALLQKRLGNLRIEEAFAPGALEFLLTYSGGHLRDLMVSVQNACVYTEGVPISLVAAQRAIQQAVRAYSMAIHESHWKKLADLDRSVNQLIPGGDEDYLTMLENLSVLEYVNGDGNFEPWYAVNPVVRELQKFKATRSEPA